jgi:hypothetical protein
MRRGLICASQNLCPLGSFTDYKFILPRKVLETLLIVYALLLNVVPVCADFLGMGQPPRDFDMAELDWQSPLPRSNSIVAHSESLSYFLQSFKFLDAARLAVFDECYGPQLKLQYGPVYFSIFFVALNIGRISP